MTKLGLEFIKHFEGCRLKAYRDVVGIWTIGYGDTQNVRPGMVITQAEADERLERRVAEFEAAVKKLVKIDLNDNQLDALTSFAYNVGPNALRKSNLLRRLNGLDVQLEDEFMKWSRAGGQILNGLLRRRKLEWMLFSGQVEAVKAVLTFRH
jgi:lysozyme